MRCPDCNKFVSYDEPQCEVESAEISGGELEVNVMIQLNCAECGGTLKECSVSATAPIEHECDPEREIVPEYSDEDEQYEVDDEGSPEGGCRLETEDRNGKPIKNSRYMKTFYGFSLTTACRCNKCGGTFDVETSGEEQASAFDECC